MEVGFAPPPLGIRKDTSPEIGAIFPYTFGL